MQSCFKGSSVFDSPAVAVLCELETAARDAGAALTVAVTTAGRLQIAPRAVLTPERIAQVQAHRDALRLLACCADAGVLDRRERFAQALAAYSGPAVLPALDFRECETCGDGHVRCWRCQLAGRLARSGDVPADWVPVGAGDTWR